MRTAWAVPLLAAVTVAAGTAAFGPLLVDSRPPPPPAWQVSYAAPFGLDEARGPVQLVVAPLGRAAAEAALARDAPEAELEWVGERVAFAHLPGACACPEEPAASALRIEAYAFLGDGTLVASNRPSAEIPQFRRSSYYVEVPAQEVHLPLRPGDAGPAPAAWLEALRGLGDALAVAPEGGVRVAVVADHPDASAVGPLYFAVAVVHRI